MTRIMLAIVVGLFALNLALDYRNTKREAMKRNLAYQEGINLALRFCQEQPGAKEELKNAIEYGYQK